eukprot:scaffold30424_cov56-Isochrysis_galbana.AAC.1
MKIALKKYRRAHEEYTIAGTLALDAFAQAHGPSGACANSGYRRSLPYVRGSRIGILHPQIPYPCPLALQVAAILSHTRRVAATTARASAAAAVSAAAGR